MGIVILRGYFRKYYIGVGKREKNCGGNMTYAEKLGKLGVF
jgi:hypothetical protein